MFKSALSTYLAQSSGVKSMSNVLSGTSHEAATADFKGGKNGGGSSSLKAAERIMKMSLEVGACRLREGRAGEGRSQRGIMGMV